MRGDVSGLLFLIELDPGRSFEVLEASLHILEYRMIGRFGSDSYAVARLNGNRGGGHFASIQEDVAVADDLPSDAAASDESGAEDEVIETRFEGAHQGLMSRLIGTIGLLEVSPHLLFSEKIAEADLLFFGKLFAEFADLSERSGVRSGLIRTLYRSALTRRTTLSLKEKLSS